MNRTLRLVAALGMLALPTVAQAQSITGSIAASATIQSVFAFGAPTALNFGNIVPGSAAFGIGSIPMQRNVGVIYSLPDGLTTGQLTSGSNIIQPSYTCGIGASNGTTITTPFTSCNSSGSIMTPIAGATALVNEWVVFRGDLTGTQTNTVPGLYSGTIHILATPN